MLKRGYCDFGRVPGEFSIVAAHQALKFREFIDHLRAEIGLCPTGGFFGQIGIRAHNRCDLARQRRDTFNTFALAAELIVEGDIGQLVQPFRSTCFGQTQVIFPEEFGVRQPCKQNLLVACQNGRALIFGFAVGHGDEFLNPAGFGVFHRKELLMLFHRGLKNLWWQIQEIRRDIAHQSHWPFHKTCDFGQKTWVFDDLEALGKSEVLGVGPDGFRAFFGV